MLTDVATIVQGPENAKLGAWVDGAPAIILNVQRPAGANVIQVVDNIKKLLPQLHAVAARRARSAHRHRSHHHDPRLGARRAVRTGHRRSCSSCSSCTFSSPNVYADHHSESRRCRFR